MHKIVRIRIDNRPGRLGSNRLTFRIQPAIVMIRLIEIGFAVEAEWKHVNRQLH